MITIRAGEWRVKAVEVERRLREALPRLGAVSVLSQGTARTARAVRRQFVEASASRPTPRPLRDAQGRRLRASAYQFGPSGAGRHRPPTGPGVAGSHLPVLFKVVLVGVVGVVSFLGGSSAYIDFTGDLPDVHAINDNPIPEDTIIYAADGSTLADIHQPGLQHYYEPLGAMGHLLPEALVAVEDANYWNEPGIDAQGIVRAAWIDWRSHTATQGASTITQQLVKLRLIGNEVTVTRKIKEAILAVQLEHSYSKSQILEQYLNTVSFGNHAQGSLAASEIFFHKPTRDLDLAQASMLAGIPQSPVYNSPFVNWDQAKNRQRQVLDAMVKNHYVSRPEADQAYAEDVSPPAHMFTAGPQIFRALGFVNWIIGELEDRYGTKAALGGGLRVYTTLNPTLQHLAEQAVVSNVQNDLSKGVKQGAMVSIDPRTGAVVTMVGSAFPDRDGGQNNMAVWPPRNPGSSMKLWTYTAAIESGRFTMVTPIVDSPIVVNMPGQEQGWKPANYDGKFHGTCPVQVCMDNSLNIPAVKVELGTGVDHVVDVARRVGAPPWYPHNDGSYTNNDPSSVFGAALTLGAYGETPLQQATGAATLAAMGIYHQPFGISKIVTSQGREVQAPWDPAKYAKQVVDPRVAFIMAQMLSNDANRALIFGTGSALTLPGRRVAAKTGTTDSFKDAWTVGFTPALASAFWFGDPYNGAMQQGFDAIYAAAPAWHVFMDQALGALNEPPSEWYAPVLPGLGVSGTANGQPVYLMPGTSAGQQAPPLPPWASSSNAPANNSNNNNRGRRG
jgi:membrane peptidoglycan carboxypeptidase